MYAVVRAGGKQYRVTGNDVITVNRLEGNPGDTLALDVLMIGDGADVKLGAAAAVNAEIVEHLRGEKVIVFKKRRRHTFRKRNGHRQDLTKLRITAIG
jgi:large subunit ribosomal protein L21